ncbi:oligosaccharide flippase family protein [Rhodoferax sp. TBRC 17198]|uniref:lipopolysaccharide biosynthesis protein n=1 Tax=Rhodoferax potami TaxID=3068338 RepID=UPI0028BF41DE|nr:oligosaccharide flippase family protein [Rhodoferax sp. TBRC 17198]MDT7522518.1 oligosaccharide flippase family protein [Rhodoferax sp. TBRC 17198]
MIRLGNLLSSIARLPTLLASLTARNAASSFVALAWLSLLSMLMIPFYIRLLGVSEWGLVAACASLQILSNFIDSGFSQILPRWVALVANHPARLRQYVIVFRRIYICLGLTMFLTLQASAGYLAHRWFKVPAESMDGLEMAIRIVSLQFFFQFFNNLHIGLWHGLQHQVLANFRACGFGTLKHLTALLSLQFLVPEAWMYTLAFASIAFLEVTVNAVSVRRLLGRGPDTASQDKITLGLLLKEVSILSAGILVGLLVSQLDRIILSRTIDVAEFGIYTVVSTFAFAFLQLQAPVTRAYFPVIVKNIQTNGQVSAAHMKRLVGGTLVICILPALMTCWFAPQILELWLQDLTVVSLGTAPFRLLLFAVVLNSLYGCIYQVIVAKGQSHKILQFNLISLASALLVVYLYGTDGGVMLGAFIWITTSLAQLMLGILWWFKTSQQ